MTVTSVLAVTLKSVASEFYAQLVDQELREQSRNWQNRRLLLLKAQQQQASEDDSEPEENETNNIVTLMVPKVEFTSSFL